MGGNGGAVRILKAMGGMGEDWEDGGKGRALTLWGEDLQDHGGTSERGQPGGTMREPGDSPDPPCSLRAFGKWHLQRGGGGEDVPALKGHSERAALLPRVPSPVLPVVAGRQAGRVPPLLGKSQVIGSRRWSSR